MYSHDMVSVGYTRVFDSEKKARPAGGGVATRTKPHVRVSPDVFRLERRPRREAGKTECFVNVNVNRLSSARRRRHVEIAVPTAECDRVRTGPKSPIRLVAAKKGE